LFSIFSQHYQRQDPRFKKLQNAPFCPRPRLLNLAKQFQLPKHCFKKSQNAPFRVIVFKTFSAAQELQENRFK